MPGQSFSLFGIVTYKTSNKAAVGGNPATVIRKRFDFEITGLTVSNFFFIEFYIVHACILKNNLISSEFLFVDTLLQTLVHF